MKPVEQRLMQAPGGDCVAACMASILELPLDDVPNLYGGKGFERSWNEWLRPIGLQIKRLDPVHQYMIVGYAIAVGWSPRFPGSTHAVVWHGENQDTENGWKNTGHIVWDPSPARDMGLGPLYEFWVFQICDPAKVIHLPEDLF